MTVLNPRKAVYAGTFDPITNGHLEVLRRAVALFDSVVIAVAGGGPRVSIKQHLFSSEERAALIEGALALEFSQEQRDKVQVSSFDGMLVDFAKDVKAKVIVRGLRAVSDYEYETQLAYTNRMLEAEVETIFLVTSEPCSFISASIVRNVALNRGDVSKMVSANVQKALSEKSD